MKATFCSLLILLLSISHLYAQMERKRAVSDAPVEELFLTGSIAGISTVTNLNKRELNSVIMHNFGTVNGGIENFWGLDQAEAVRLGIDYGITDNLSVGIGRTNTEDNVDVRMKYTILRQMKSNKIPIELALKVDMGVNTQKNTQFDDFTFIERLNYFGSLMIARKFLNTFTLQLAPMISHFNTVVIDSPTNNPQNTHFALGIGSRYILNERKSLTFEFLPVLGKRNKDTRNHIAFGYEIETGGHVFQMFFMSGRWFTEQHLITRTTSKFFSNEFRLGFNVNRVFGI